MSVMVQGIGKKRLTETCSCPEETYFWPGRIGLKQIQHKMASAIIETCFRKNRYREGRGICYG